MSTLNKLLVAYDFSESSDKAVELAIGIAEKFNSQITVLHVVEPNPDFIGFEAGPGVVREQLASEFHREHHQLQSVVSRYKTRYAHIQPILAQGATVDTILSHAEKHGCDLIIAGSHNKNKLKSILLGSVSEGLTRNAKISVLISR